VYRWIEHTAEVELRIEAPSEAQVFREALEAVSELLGEPGGGEPAVAERIELQASDRPALLAAWIEELAFLAEARRLIPERLRELALREDGLRATVEARRGEPRHLVKAVTYHRLVLERRDGDWVAGAVLDV
jgi:SHS2 domain-containing protein